jgi:hypothetical protein
MSAPLSPAAQAVLDAFNCFHPMTNRRIKIAAALRSATLRAAVDQVVAEDQGEGPDCCLTVAKQIRADFLAIATELEAQP